MNTIDTWSRYLFLNSYAGLLLILAVGVTAIPLYKFSLWWLIPQGLTAFIALGYALKILASWKHKRREYNYLMKKNQDDLYPYSFTDFADAPCGRLLMQLVIKDLGYDRSVYHKLLKICKEYD